MSMLSLREDSALENYMKQVKKIPILSKEEEMELALKYYETKDVKAAEKLVTSNLRFVVKVAYGFKNYGFRILDLVQEGNLGLMRAVQKFNPHRGYRIITYAVWWIKSFIQEYIIRSHSLVRLGTTQDQRHSYFRLRSVRALVDQEIQNSNEDISKEDRADWIAFILGIPPSVVTEMELRTAAQDFSLDAQVSTEDSNSVSYIDLMESPDESQELSVAKRQEEKTLKQDVHRALKELSPKERKIIEERIFSDNPPTLREIGEKYGVSRERIRQIESQALTKLRQNLVAYDFA